MWADAHVIQRTPAGGMLDIRAHHRILAIEPDRLLLRAEAGAPWAERQATTSLTLHPKI